MKKSAAVTLRYVAGFVLVFLATFTAQAQASNPKTLRDIGVALVAAVPLAVEKWITHPS